MATNRERLATWHRAVFERDRGALLGLLAEDAVFHAPAYFKPRQGRDTVAFILENAIEVFENFTYHRELIDGDDWALEFSANIGEVRLKGIDLIRWNAAGQIVDFEVYVRPAKGLQALAEAMAARVAEKLTSA